MNEIEQILTSILDCQRIDLYLKDTALNEEQFELLDSILMRRLRGEPLQYILGYSEFMGLKFKVNKYVLIPRPETELLVEKALEILTKDTPVKKYKILDIGTGCGNIAISLAKFLPELRIIGVDISNEALKVAEENACLNGVEEQIEFFKGDLFRELKYFEFDMIISNPPYIKSKKIPRLAVEVQNEPEDALDGLEFFRRIIRESPTYLKKDGFLIMEMGYNQSETLLQLFNTSSKFKIVELVKDYNKIERIIIARRVN